MIKIKLKGQKFKFIAKNSNYDELVMFMAGIIHSMNNEEIDIAELVIDAEELLKKEGDE